MKKIILLALGGMLAIGIAWATPEEDRLAFIDYHKKRFPDVAVEDYVNGVYAIDKGAYEQWQQIEEFAPYELALTEGEELFDTPFANGKTYADCFPNGGIGIRQNYPYFDTNTGQVKTLELEINECREKNGEKPYGYKKGKIASLSAYMAYTSRGNKLNIVIPDDPRALAAYENGKEYYYSKRGQLNFSCADCHIKSSSMMIRADKLSPALGHPTHFPVYRSKWDDMGTLHRRFDGCNKQVRATPLPAQGEEYRNLEYFLTYMSTGMVVNGPGSRK
ncbi:MAG: sulfur oxidation c-type cytochrome SoxA [Woeseiaceae bacterium]